MKKAVTVFILFMALPLAMLAQSIDGNFAIKNVETGMLLRPEGANNADNTPIVLYSPTNWKCLTWDFIATDEEDTYQLRNLFTSKTFFPDAGQKESGTALKQIELEQGNKDQQWVFEVNDDETYRIKLKNTELYITPHDKSGAFNSKVVLKEKMDGKLQLWTIYEQSPTM